jgi:3-carboxy-cis,cis-muconate cycloisomerase
LRTQAATLVSLAGTHRSTLMAGRTLGQHAVPITFGLKAAGWLDGLVAAGARLDRLSFPAQVGGAAGTLAAAAELARGVGDHEPARAALALASNLAERLGLATANPWHTGRATFTSIGDALVGCTDAWGKIATDVATYSRPEIAELAEPAAEGRGGSSTMPHKRNPVLSVLVRRAAIAAPPLASTLHLAAAFAEDERPAGGWHAEWATLRALGRRTAVAASHTTELVTGLHVDADRMAATALSAWSDLTAERDSLTGVTGATPSGDDYLGATAGLIDIAVKRAQTWLRTHP